MRYRTRHLQIVGIANPLAIGSDRLAMIGARAGTTRVVCDALSAMPETSYVILATGSYDVMVEVICRDIAHFTEVVTDRMQEVDGVVSTESFLVLEAHKLADGWGSARCPGPSGARGADPAP